MPKIAVISDIHANAPALRAVLAEADALGINGIVCCGDIVGYGPHPAECVALIRERQALCVLGNHDHYAIIGHDRPASMPTGPDSFTNPVWAGIRHAVDELDEDAFAWLASLPRTLAIPGAIVAHAALHEDDPWPYLLGDADARPTLQIMETLGHSIAFFGHTHQQEFFALRGKPAPVELPEATFRIHDECVCAVIVGSVGQPRTGDPRAAWTLWDSGERTFQFRRTPYPIHETTADIRKAGLPESSGRRLLGGGGIG